MKHSRFLCRAAITISLISATTLAQCSDPLPLTEMSLEDLSNIEVVTASKRPMRLLETPAAVFVITREDISRYGYRTLADALHRIAGFYTSSDHNYNYLGVRGYARPGDYNTRILLLIDGHRMNDPRYDMAAIGEDFPLDIASIERIEVAKGPGSALWGSNALLGVINVITRKGSDIEGNNLYADGGTYSSSKLFAETGGTYKNNAELACAVSSYNSNGQSSIYFPEFDSPDTHNGIANASDGEHAVHGYLAGSYRNFEILFDSGARKKVIPTASWGTVFNDSGTYTVDKRSFIELSYKREIDLKHNGQLLARAYHDEYNYHGDYIYDYPPLTVNQDHVLASWYGGEIRYSADVVPWLTQTVGVEYMRAYQDDYENYDVNPYAPYFDTSCPTSSYSSYAQTEMSLLSSLRMIAGLRLDNYSTFGNHVSPRMALIYSPADDSAIKLLYGKAFRAPNANELTYTPTLQPEENITTELIWERSLNNRLRLVADLFHYDLQHIITEEDDGSGNMAFVNGDTVRGRGIDLQLETMRGNNSSSYIGLSKSKAWNVRTGDRIINSPAFLASAGFSAPAFSKRVIISPEIQYVDSKLTLAGKETSPFCVGNVTLYMPRASRGLDLSLSVYNILNHSLYIPASPAFTQDKLPQEGRTVRLQLRHQF